MRVLLDYRPALRARTGVGEYVFQLSRALLGASPQDTGHAALDLTLFSSSWRDRLERDRALDRATIIDRRIPVRALNLAWHRFGWPTAEMLTGAAYDVAHSPHPLLLPTRSAARVVTIHDLYFLAHPERSHAEVRRDYPALARAHAHRADRIIVPSHFTALEVERKLEIPAERIAVCPHGRPLWSPRAAAPPDGYILCVGTLEPRKNVGGLLDAYQRLIDQVNGRAPALVLAGHAPRSAAPLLERIAAAPLLGHVRHIGYVDPSRRRQLYEAARLLVQPSFEEGFGLPVLEAMTIGVPVVAANRGALPEVLDDVAPLVEPDDPEGIAAAIRRVLDDEASTQAAVARGLARAQLFDWSLAARCVLTAYQVAIEHRACESA